MSSERISFKKESDATDEKISSEQDDQAPWTVLVVDDDESIHSITRLLLKEFTFQGSRVELFHAYSAAEARQILTEQNEFSLALLDVVMETDEAGLDLVKFIREDLQNRYTQVVLRTGQPGMAPEQLVIENYDINSYWDKSEITSDRMRSLMTVALRAYSDLKTIRNLAEIRAQLQTELTSKNKSLTDSNARLQEEIESRRSVEAELEKTNNQLESIINNSTALISLKTPEGYFELVNESFLATFALKREDVLGHHFSEIFPESVTDMFRKNHQTALEADGGVQFEEAFNTAQGEHYLISVKFTLKDPNGIIQHVCSISTDITEKMKQRDEIFRLAKFNLLTNLPNRSYFIDQLKQETVASQGKSGKFAVIILNLDRFQYINDAMGHDVGDKILIQVAQRLTDLLLENGKDAESGVDRISHLGGDEFGFIYRQYRIEDQFTDFIQRAEQKFSEPFTVNDQEIAVTASMGVSRFPMDGDDPKQLLKNADVALVRAKRAGKDCFRVFQESQQIISSSWLALEVGLRKLIGGNANDQLYLCYQPKVCLTSGEFKEVEALVRWEHPERGLISPGEFIPILEETGLIRRLGEVILRNAFTMAARSHQGDHPLKVAVNLSPHQIKDPNFIHLCKKILVETSCEPEWIEFELTEGAIIEDYALTKSILDEISSLGISLAIDDFGTGYSSLKHLKELPFNVLKIDRSFIMEAGNSERDRAIVTTVAQLADNLDMSIVAEGVETPEQLELISSLDLDNSKKSIQGFLFSRPLKEGDLESGRKQVKEIWNNLNGA